MASRILFIGNSFVARNDLPGMLARLAAASGREVQTASIVAGGASLRRHFNSGAVAAALAAAPTDVVVLQEQSTLPIKNPVRYRENVQALMPVINAAQAMPILYMTWARRDEPQAQTVLTRATEETGKAVGARVAPVGKAWQSVLESDPTVPPVVKLFAADGIHPTPAGTFLAACVIYLTIFKDAALPPAPPRVGLDEATVNRLIQAANRVCFRTSC